MPDDAATVEMIVKKLSPPLAAVVVCLAAVCPSAVCLAPQAALGQAAYVRPLSPPPDKPAHGFYLSSIQLVPEDLDTDNGLYTATVEVRMQDLPNFEAKNQSMKFTLQHVKATGTLQEVRDQAKKAAEAHFDEIIAAFTKYKGDFAKGRH